jgi:hypothetical protein
MNSNSLTVRPVLPMLWFLLFAFVRYPTANLRSPFIRFMDISDSFVPKVAAVIPFRRNWVLG